MRVCNIYRETVGNQEDTRQDLDYESTRQYHGALIIPLWDRNSFTVCQNVYWVKRRGIWSRLVNYPYKYYSGNLKQEYKLDPERVHVSNAGDDITDWSYDIFCLGGYYSVFGNYKKNSISVRVYKNSFGKKYLKYTDRLKVTAFQKVYFDARDFAYEDGALGIVNGIDEPCFIGFVDE